MRSPELANILVAYPYCKKDVVAELIECAPHTRVLIDSGAFTAWKAGKTVDLDEYCRFLEALPFTPWRYFMLDVVGDPQATLHNYDTMLRRGFKPVPIFTRGESLDILDHYFTTSDLVGIGGLVRTRNNRAFVNGIMAHVGHRAVHWLGFINSEFVRAYRPFSCDSSTWAAGCQFGSITLYFGRGRWRQVHKEVFAKPPPPDVQAACRRVGIEPRDLARVAAWSGRDAPALIGSLRAFQLMANELHTHVGTLLFAAVSMSGLTRRFAEAVQFFNREEATA
jgi:hypothetical protein